VDASGVTSACRRNFAFLHESLRPVLKRPRRLSALAPGACPLMYPLLVENRPALLAHLHERGIEALPFWAGYHPACDLREFPDARRLKDGLAGLPVHQDLDERDMRYVANETLRALEVL
jgi:perosamine synthetase